MKNSLLTSLLLAGLVFAAAAQQLDVSFQSSITTVSYPEGVALLDDGRYYVWGGFSYVNGIARRGVVRYNADGTVDESFNVGVGANETIATAAVQSDGKLLVAGLFTRINGVTANGFVRLNTDGSIDPTFNASVNFLSGQSFRSYKLLVLADGKILLGAPFAKINGSSINTRIARFNTDGSRDATFNNVTFEKVEDMKLQSSGKIIVISSAPGNHRLYRLNTDGTIDPSFSSTGSFNAMIWEILVKSDDKIVAGGSFTTFNGVSVGGLAGLNADGTLDTDFQANNKLVGSVYALERLANNKFLVTGTVQTFDGVNSIDVLRFNNDGTLDPLPEVGTATGNWAQQISVNAAGDILLAGPLTGFNGANRELIAVITSTGALKPMTENADLRRSETGYEVIPQGPRLIVAHGGHHLSGAPSRYLGRIEADGAPDATYLGTSKPGSFFTAACTQNDGQLIASGYFTSFNFLAASRIMRISAEGELDQTFSTNVGTGPDVPASALAVAVDGKILVGGSFATFNGTARRALVRLNANGTLDNTFNAANNLPTSTTVTSIIALADGKVLIGGVFDQTASSPAVLMRLNSDGTIDNAYPTVIASGPQFYYKVVSAMTFLDNGKLLVGGEFQSVNGVNRKDLALLNADGTLDNTVYDGFVNIREILKQPDGKLVVYESAKGLRRLNADGTPDASFQAVSIQGSINSMAYHQDRIIVVGALEQVNGSTVQGIAALSVPTSASPTDLRVTSVSSGQITLAWNDNTADETGYEVYRSVGNGEFNLIHTTGANAASYQDNNVTASTNYQYLVKAIIAGNNSAYSNKVSQTVLPNEWTTIAGTVPARADGVAATVNGKAYVGLGLNATGKLKDWWEFNPEGNVWTQKTEFPGTARFGAVAFSANGKIYVGTGNDQSGGFERDFYEYDPATDNWTPKADFPEDFASAAGIVSGVAFSIGDIGYVGLGNTGTNNTQAFFKYNPATNQWTGIASFPAAGRTGAIAFATDAAGYVGFGSGGLNAHRDDLWMYDPLLDEWTQQESGPGTGRSSASATTLNGTGHVLGGTENTSGFGGPEVFTNTNFSFNTSTATWNTGAAIPGVARREAVSFSIGSRGYVFGGVGSGTVYLSDLHAFADNRSYLPSAPTALQVAFVGLTNLSLTWQDNATNESNVEIEYAIGSNDNFMLLATLGPDVTTYQHTSLTANTRYYYRVRTTNEFGASEYSNIGDGITTAPPLNPHSVVGEGLADNSTIKISWTSNSATPAFTQVYRRDEATQEYVLIHTSALSAVEYQDADRDPGVDHFYRIRSVNEGGTSGFVNIVVPAAPTALTPVILDRYSVVFSWTDNSSQESSFHLFVSESDNTAYDLANFFNANVTQGPALFLTLETLYFFKLRAVTANGRSFFSNELSVETLGNIPPKPVLNEIVNKTTTSLQITWSDNSAIETGFELERSTGTATAFSLIANIAANATNYSDNGLAPNTTYEYRIRAVNGFGVSEYSEVVSGKTLQAIPTAPTNLSATPTNDDEVTLSWSDASNESGYEVYRAITTQDDFELLTTTPANTTEFIDAGLVIGTSYFYRIRSINEVGTSDYTPIASVVITGIENMIGWSGISVFPNPAETSFEIANHRAEPIAVTVHSSAGTALITVKIHALGNQRIDCSQWPAGMYVLKLNNQAKPMKIIKE